MTTPAHTDLDSNNPQGSQTPANAMTSTLNNLRALRDAIVSGRLEGFVFTRIQGGGATQTRAQFFQFLNASLGIGFRWNVTWSGFQMATVADEWTNDNGSSWTAINSAQANTYDVANNITATTNSGGMRALLFEVMTKVMQVVSDFGAHAAATGTAVHGLATMAIQAANNVLITGGFIDGTPVGDTTRARGSFTRVVETNNPLTPTLNAGAVVDWAYGGTKITINGTNAITFANIPTGEAGHVVDVSSFSGATWPAAVDWGSSGIPTLGAVRAKISLSTNDTGTKVAAVVGWHL